RRYAGHALSKTDSPNTDYPAQCSREGPHTRASAGIPDTAVAADCRTRQWPPTHCTWATIEIPKAGRTPVWDRCPARLGPRVRRRLSSVHCGEGLAAAAHQGHSPGEQVRFGENGLGVGHLLVVEVGAAGFHHAPGRFAALLQPGGYEG